MEIEPVPLFTAGPEGTRTVGVRLAIRADDGAAVYMKRSGRLDASQGSQDPA